MAATRSRLRGPAPLLIPGSPGPSNARVATVLLIGIAAVSTAGVMIVMAEAPALSIAAYRLAIASVLVAPVAARHSAELGRLNRSGAARAALAGVALAAHFAFWIASLDHTTVASSVTLVTVHPLIVAGASRLLYGESVASTVLGGVVLAMLGAIVVTFGDAGQGDAALFGDLLALGGGLAFAVYVLVGRDVRQRLSLPAYVGIVYPAAAVVLTAVALIAGAPLSGFDASTWWLLVLLALVPQVVGHTSFNWALPHVSATLVSGAVLGEILGSAAFAWLVLEESPPITTFIGGALIVSGLAVAGTAESRRRRAAAVEPIPKR